MKLIVLCGLLLGLGNLHGQQKNPSLTPIEDQPGLPRVLLIGDSISMGYTLPVRRALEGKANVHRIPMNGGPTTRGLANIDRWLGDGQWDVIHFNWGIHDLRHMEDGKRQVEPPAYQANLRALVSRLQKTGATLIFATTTPIPAPPLKPERTFGEVAEYNEIARGLMSEMGVAVNELNAWITPRFSEFQKPQDLHYTEAGSTFLAEKVSAAIESVLSEE